MRPSFVQDTGILVIAVTVGLAAGAFFGIQPSVNGHLSRHLAHPLQASLISFASGTAMILAMTVAAGIFPPRFTVPVSNLPWWIWLGGAIGVFMVTSSLILVPRVGSLPWFAAIMTGQVIAAALLDHFGWLGNPKTPPSALRLVGTVTLLAGLLMIVQAKRSEAEMKGPTSQPAETAMSDPDAPSPD